ncbi:hypothetical protein RY831_11715 [Noviherbaspirillum sp. CPCC 100848]|uniref:Uncharacterized protein n=1 Tax=Noviherbaspirillum album TaxID=3080276 RepID=A0ABU6J9G6_9BURK|nr:hypothetical protein [Noviherbaspirillum sp. CPCC 100848]MEC4719819.1 hypothetical protein [Noviherbaspirillum sp. CPCC 100848]
MKLACLHLLIAGIPASAGVCSAATASPYAGQENRQLKSPFIE